MFFFGIKYGFQKILGEILKFERYLNGYVKKNLIIDDLLLMMFVEFSEYICISFFKG